MNQLTELLSKKQNRLLSVFFTAGYPQLDSTTEVLLSLQESGIDFVEVGMPYSDPLADGPVIQHTNTIAIDNGMTIKNMFSQLHAVKNERKIPVILMGYLNPVLQFGMEAFCREASQAGVSGIILPDLPMAEYKEHYDRLFRAHDLHFIFLITPTTKPERIREIDHASSAFIYAVSASATTGAGSSQTADGSREHKIDYLKRIASMKLDHPVVVGFGIHDHDTLKDAWQWASGAIVGTAYLQELHQAEDEREAIKALLKKLGDRVSG